MMNLTAKTIQFAGNHKKAIAGVMVAGVAPLVITNIPEAYGFVTSLPEEAQWVIGGIAAASAVVGGVKGGRHAGRVIDSARRRAEALVLHQRNVDAKRKNARLRNQAFRKANLPGAEKVVMVERSAGNISNVSKERSTLPPALQEELAAAKRVVAVVGDTSPGLELDAEPDLLVYDHDQYLAVFKKSPVRDDIQDAIRRTAMWLPRQELMLDSFMNECEVQVGVQITALGCTAMTDSLFGFGGRTWGSEANLQFYVHDPREEAVLNHEDSADLANGHREYAEVPSLVAAGGVSIDSCPGWDWDPTSGRSHSQRPKTVDNRSFEDQLLGLETEWYTQAGRSGDRVFLISNFNGMKQNSVIRRTVDIVESASLRNYFPTGSGPSRSTWPDHADVSHIVAGPWQPATPMSFGDSHSAVVTAKEIASGHWESQFSGYAPELPLELRPAATTFITGNPRAGMAFIEALEGALPIKHTFITHWNERSPAAYIVFCIPAFHEEIKAAGLRFPDQVFTKRNKQVG